MVRLIRRVLVVDDDPDLREYARVVLEGAGMTVDEAGSVGEFKQMLEDGIEADAIVLDLTMPGESGWIALRALKADPAHKDIPVIIATSHDDDQFRAAARDAGALSYVTKPYKEDDLMAALRGRRRDAWGSAV